MSVWRNIYLFMFEFRQLDGWQPAIPFSLPGAVFVPMQRVTEAYLRCVTRVGVFRFEVESRSACSCHQLAATPS